MARPTKQEQERRRIADLLAEGKGPNGEPIEDANILSETKNPPKVEDKTGGFTISELENEIETSTLGKGAGTTTTEEKPAFDINTGDARQVDTEDPNYVKPSGHDRFRESIIENESDANRAATGPPPTVNNLSGDNLPPPPPPQRDFAEPVINGSTTPDPEADKDKDKPLVDDFNKMNPTQQKEQIEMFADVILTNYGQLYQMAFTGFCSVKMNKMEILDKDGILRLSMIIDQDATGKLTVRQQFLNYNKEVEDAFKVTDEMKEQIRGPLIMVLQEKGIAPSPMVTLMIALGGHLLQGVVNCVGLKAKMDDQLETFKQFKKEQDEKELAEHKERQSRGPGAVLHKTAEAPKPEQKEAAVVSMEEVLKTTPVAVEIKSEASESTNNSGISMEDVVGN